jgi:hypothetical protein
LDWDKSFEGRDSRYSQSRVLINAPRSDTTNPTTLAINTTTS